MCTLNLNLSTFQPPVHFRYGIYEVHRVSAIWYCFCVVYFRIVGENGGQRNLDILICGRRQVMTNTTPYNRPWQRAMLEDCIAHLCCFLNIVLILFYLRAKYPLSCALRLPGRAAVPFPGWPGSGIFAMPYAALPVLHYDTADYGCQ